MNSRPIQRLVPAITLSIIFCSQSVSQSFCEKFDRYIVSHSGVHLFSGVVLVANQDSILFHKAYGLANYEWSVPNTTSSVFRIASLSKAFTAAMILQMAESGKINLDSPVSEYLPEYEGIYRDSITIRHLLAHISGIPHYNSIPGYDPLYTRVPMSKSEYIRFISSLRPLFSPGKKFHYSSPGYFLLGAILEKVSGKDFKDLLCQNILIPAKINSICFDEMTALRPFMTTGYSFDQTGIIHCRFEDTYKSRGCGGMIATAYDLHRWTLALRSGILLKDTSFKMMFSNNSGPYGFGWVIKEVKGENKFEKQIVASHEGSDFGFASHISLNLTNGTCIIVLSNIETAPVRKISEGLTGILNGKEINPPVIRPIVKLEGRTLSKYTGKYQISPDYSISVYAEKNGLEINWTGLNDKLLLFSSSDSTFYIRENDKLFTFESDNEGKIVSLCFNDSSGLIRARKQNSGD